MSLDSTRKPSGSSAHSTTNSPTASPNNPHSSRRITPTTSSNMLSVGAPSGIMGINQGWQVWRGSPSSTRNPSVSSATSGNDLSSSQGDITYRGNLHEGWTASRPASGSWDDAVGVSPRSSDFGQLQEGPLPLQSSRPRQGVPSFSGQIIDTRTSKLTSHHGVGTESHAPRYRTTSSPSAPTVSIPFPQTTSQVVPNSSYEPMPNTSGSAEELALSIRGMAVEDDLNVNRQQQSHIPPQMHPQIRPAFGAYNAFYSLPNRDSFGDYPYGYDGYRGPSEPSLYGSPAANTAVPSIFPGMPTPNLHAPDLHRQQTSMFYDYGPARPPGQQFYYPTQPVMFPPAPSPMINPPMLPSPGLGGDKKRDPFNMPQQLLPPNIMYNAMRSPSMPQAYTGGLEFNPQAPLVLPGVSIFSPNLQGLPVFSQAMHQGRREVSLRSPILEEFRANKTRNWELRDIFGYIVEFSGDQHGSRFIQQKLESATSEEKEKVFDEIVPDNTLQLIQDVFGNYVIQKIFEHGTQLQKTRLASAMEGHVVSLSMQMYGCRVVQKAIEHILPEQQASFVREIEPFIFRCVRDANGNHVIQKIVERVSPDRLAFVHTFRGNVHDMSSHPYGCRVLQRCLEHLPEDMVAPLLEELHKSTIHLMQDQFGNYVIQFILEHGRPQDRALVVAKLRGQLLRMAQHKFASNVCEKALVSAEPESRRALIDEIIIAKYDSLTPVMSMMKDQYANYVLQKAILVADADQRAILIAHIRPQLAVMRRHSNTYSKHLASIERLIEKFSPLQPAISVMSPETAP